MILPMATAKPESVIAITDRGEPPTAFPRASLLPHEYQDIPRRSQAETSRCTFPRDASPAKITR